MTTPTIETNKKQLDKLGKLIESLKPTEENTHKWTGKETFEEIAPFLSLIGFKDLVATNNEMAKEYVEEF